MKGHHSRATYGAIPVCSSAGAPARQAKYPAAKLIKPGKEKGGKTMASSIGKTSNYAKSLAQSKKEKGENIPEFEPPKLANLERKL